MSDFSLIMLNFNKNYLSISYSENINNIQIIYLKVEYIVVASITYVFTCKRIQYQYYRRHIHIIFYLFKKIIVISLK